MSRTKAVCLYALFGAVICILAQISIITPSGIALTFQTLGVSLCGYVLNKKGIYSVLAYILLGTVGIPVFSSLTGGLGILLGKSGGFIIGFIPLCFLCGIGGKSGFGILGVFICHIIGVLQFSLVSGVGIIPAFLSVSLPFLLKDIISVVLAFYLSMRIIKTGIIDT